MDNDYLELPKMSLTSLLRWLALLEAVIGTGSVIALAVINLEGVGIAAATLTGMKWVAFISILLYSLSYVNAKATDIKTVFTISVQQMLRYAIIGILVLGFVELILNSLASALISAGFIASVFAGILSSITFTVIFYSVYLQIKTKKSPEIAETKLSATKAKSPTGKDDAWVDSLLKDVDKPDKPIG